MELLLTKENICIKYAENPFIKRKTDSGLILASGLANSDDTGNMEQLTRIIGFGIVTHVGPDVKYLSVGDGVYFDTRSVRPLPHTDLFVHLNENIVMGYVKDDGTLADKISKLEKELEEEAKQAALSKKLNVYTSGDGFIN